MKNITATITTSYDIKNPDQAPQIEELGYNPEWITSDEIKKAGKFPD